MHLTPVVVLGTSLSQICTFKYKVQNTNGEMGSQTIISLDWRLSNNQPWFEAENLDYDAEISYKTLNDTANKAHICIVELKLVRKFVRCLVEIIFPTALLVLVCSVSLYQ